MRGQADELRKNRRRKSGERERNEAFQGKSVENANRKKKKILSMENR
jgi:hypothetical protein